MLCFYHGEIPGNLLLVCGSYGYDSSDQRVIIKQLNVDLNFGDVETDNQ